MAGRKVNCVLGIDVGGTHLRAGLYDPRRHALHCVQTAATEAAGGGNHALARVAGLAHAVVEAGRTKGYGATRVGIGIPELVSTAGVIQSQSTLPWRAASVRAKLRRYGPVTIAADVMAAARAEARLGAGRGHAVFLYVSVGTGISSCLVIAGQVYAGAHGHALCLASGATHATPGSGGAIAYRSLEAEAAGPGILARARALGCAATDVPALLRAAGDGPGVAREVVDAAAAGLALHVAILANALDPGLIVLGGGLGCAPGRYGEAFRASLPHYTWGSHAQRLKVRRALLGPRAGLFGAALCAVEAKH